MTQLEQAKNGTVTEEARIAAEAEHMEPERLRELIASGKVVLPKNKHHELDTILAIGEGLRTKVNANIGTSGECASLQDELEKLNAAVEAGADSIMDLSTGGDLEAIRKAVLELSPVMVGAVPIYSVAANATQSKSTIKNIDPDHLLRSIDEQCAQGIDYITVHCGVTRDSIKRIETYERLMPSVSRGASILMKWMRENDQENPLYVHFDALLDIAYAHDVTLSLGDGFRPGTIVDATDGPQLEELIILGELARRARARNVQVMIEGPGHVPLNQVVANVTLEKRLCDGAPFYLLGPLTTDIAPGYDHITGAIGGALAAMSGADFLCYVTPAEHLCLPDKADVRAGVIASRIAAHSADICKGVPGAVEQDRAMSVCRKNLDWDGMMSHAVDPQWAREKLRLTSNKEFCSMCGELCAVKLSRK